MQLTYLQIQAILVSPAFESFFKKRFPLPVAIKLAKFYRELSFHMKVFAKKKEKVIEKFIKVDENNKPIKIDGNYIIPPEVTSAYNTELQSLQETFVSLPPKIKLNPAKIPVISGYEANVVLDLIEIINQ